MRLINADKIYPDVRTQNGVLAISQGQLACAEKVNAVLIPNDATNGDVLKAVFPYCKTRSENTPTSFMEFTLDGVVGYAIEKSWWNAKYRAEEGNKE